jgi:hypothetical protein
MFSRIRRRFSYANIAATLALVFAMTGGAYAANKYLITSTKQISPKVLKALTGKPGKSGANGAAGAAGSTGPAGVAGAKGETGASGAQGNEGPAGQSVTSKQLTNKEAACNKEGGSEFTAGATKTTACNGSPWTAGGTLPKGATETGQWATTQDKGSEAVQVGISFPIKLAKTLDEEHVHYIKVGEAPPTGCSGSVAKPEAAPGNLCVFTKAILGFPSIEPLEIPFTIRNAEAGEVGAGPSGAYLTALAPAATQQIIAAGDWIVTE